MMLRPCRLLQLRNGALFHEPASERLRASPVIERSVITSVLVATAHSISNYQTCGTLVQCIFEVQPNCSRTARL